MKHPAMRLFVLFTTLFVVSSLIFLSGCPTAPKPPAPAKVENANNDARRLGINLLRQATDTPRCREALHLLNNHNQQHPERASETALDAEARKFLQENVGLSAEELSETEASNFRPADAHYLNECFLLRDAARSIEIKGLAPEEAARNCFRWVARHVLLHEQGDDWLPPALVLRRGYGSARDRALAFLGLLREQEQQLEGCMFTLPDAADDVVLVGVLAPLPKAKHDDPATNARDVWLFDPRLGAAVATAQGKVATLKNVQADPALLQPSGLTGAQFKAAQVRVACPLSAISLRMRELEKDLSVHDRVVLYLDPARLLRDVALATALSPRVWNTSGAGNVENSPTRAWRLLLPADEGGVDKENRFKRFQVERAPWSPVWLSLTQIKLGPSQLAEPALNHLLRITADLCERYDLQPHEMLLHGKGDDAVQRLHRGRSFLEHEGADDEADFQRAVAEWRARANAAYAAVANQDPNGQGLVNGLWADDQFMLALLQVDLEDEPGKYPKKTLTRIASHSIREYLYQRSLWLRAILWQDRAERDQVRAERAAPGNKLAESAKNAWRNTRPAWNLYIDRIGMGPAARQRRLDTVLAHLKNAGDPGSAVHAAHLIEALHLDLHHYYAARMNHARAAYHLDGAKAGAALLRDVDAELSVLLDRGKNDAPGLKPDVDAIQQRLRGTPATAHSLELLQQDWTPQGNFYWLQQRVRHQLRLWEKA